MADIRKIVEIAFQLTGIDGNSTKKLTNALEKIDKTVQNSRKSLDGLQSSLDKIKVPASFDKFVGSLESLNNIKAPNIKQVAEGFERLSKFKVAPNLDKFVVELKKLTEIKAPNIKQIAEGLETLSGSTVKIGDVGKRLRVLQRNLKKFSEVRVPNIKNITEGLKSLMKIEFFGFEGKIKTLTDSLKKFSTIKLPGVTGLVNGLKKLIELDIEKVVGQIKKLNEAFKTLNQSGDLSSFAKFARDIGRMSAAFKEASATATKAGKNFKKLGDDVAKVGKQVRTLQDRIVTFVQYRGLNEVFNLIKNSITGGIKAIIDYDQALKDLQAITGATSLGVAQMGAKILEVAATTKFSATEIAEGMRTIGQAGFSASEAVQTMQAVSDLATGTLSSMASTVDLVTTTMRVFHIDASRSSEVVDVFANAVNRSKLTVDKLRTAMNYLGPIARDSGISFKELSASMMTLANSGLRASTIGTGLRRVFAELVDPSKKLKEAADAVGVSLHELDPSSQSLQSVISNLGLVINDTSVAFDIFGKRGAAAVLALTDQNSQFATMLSQVNQSGTAAAQASKQMEGLGVMFKNLSDRLGVLAIALGELGITDAFRALISVAKSLVIALTAVAQNGFVKLVSKTTLLIASITALGAAFLYLNGSILPKFVGLIKAIPALFSAISTAVSGATVTILGLQVAMAPLLVLFTTLAAIAGTVWFAIQDGAKAASEEAAKMADEYKNLGKAVEDYYETTSNLAPGSNAMIEASKKLRNELMQVAVEFGPLSQAASEAANSINPLTGALDDGGKALKAYREEVNTIEFKELSTALEQAGDSMFKQSSLLNRSVQRTKEAFGQLGIYATGFISAIGANLDDMTSPIENFDKTLGKAFRNAVARGKQIEDAWAVSKDVATGAEGAFIRLKEAVEGWNRANLTDQQQKMVDAFDFLNERASSYVQKLLDMDDIRLDSSVESVTALAEQAGLTDVSLQAVIEHFKALQEANEDAFTNIIEKWEKESDPAFLSNLVEGFNSMGVAIDAADEKELKRLSNAKKGHIEQLNRLKKEAAETERQGKATEAYWKDYWKRYTALLQDADVTRAQISTNRTAQMIIAYQKEKADLEKHLKDINRIYADQTKERVRHEEEARAASAQRMKRIQEGLVLSPDEQTEEYKKALKEREAAHALYLSNIKTLEANGKISHEEAEHLKLKATLDYYAQAWAAAQTYFNNLDETEDPTTYKKAQETALKAEKKYYDERAKYLDAYTDQVREANEEITSLEEKRVDELEKNQSKIESITDKHTDKLEDIQEKYADKVSDSETKLADKTEAINKKLADKVAKIHEKLAQKLKDLDNKIKNNRKKTTADILNIETSSADKVRNVRQRGMSESAKDADNQKAAADKIRQGIELVNKARSEGDAAALASGQKLIEQAQELAEDFQDEKKAIKGIQTAEEALVKARDAEGYINELELIKEKKEAIAEAAKKEREAEAQAEGQLAKLSKEHALKLQNMAKEVKKALADEKKVYDTKIANEGKRHLKVMKNLEEQKKKQEEIIRIADGFSGDVQGTTPSGVSVDPAVNAAEQERHKLVKGNLETEVELIRNKSEAYTESASRAMESEREVSRTSRESMAETEAAVKELSENSFKIVEENGVLVISEMTKQEKEMVQAVTRAAEESSDAAFDNIKNKANPTFDEIEEAFKTLKTTVNEDGGIEIGFAPPEFDEVKEEINKEVKGIEPEVPIKLEVEDPKDEIKDIEKQLPEPADVEVAVEATVDGEEDVSDLEKGVKALKDKAVRIASSVLGTSKLQKMKDLIDDIKSKTVTVRVNVKYNKSGGGSSSAVAKYASGGEVDHPEVQQYADGGSVFQRLIDPYINRGSGTKDDVPAMLMKGEFVLKQSAVAKYGKKFLHMLNQGLVNMQPQMYAAGGLVQSLGEKAVNVSRTAELALNPAAPYTDNGVTYNINAPSFHNHVEGKTSGIRSFDGKHRATGLVKMFSSLIPKMQTGGSTDYASQFLSEKNSVLSQYDSEINAVRENGQDEVAFRLEMEKVQLEELANDLALTLDQVRLDYQASVLDATEDLRVKREQFESEKLDTELTYSRALSGLNRERASIEMEYRKEKRELEQRQFQAVNRHGEDSPEASNAGIALTELKADQEKRLGALRTKEETVRFNRNQFSKTKDEEAKSYESQVENEVRVLKQNEQIDIAAHQSSADIQAANITKQTQSVLTKIDQSVDPDIAAINMQLRDQLEELKKQYQYMMQEDERISSGGATPSNTPNVDYWLNSGGFVGYPFGKRRKVDSIKALLTPGEFVVNEEAVQHYGKDFLDALNNQELGNEANFPGHAPSMVGDTLMHLQAPSFHSNLQNRVSKIKQPHGVKAANNIIQIFKDAVPRLVTGGFIGNSEQQMMAEIANVTEEYTAQIDYLKAMGYNTLAFILEQEQAELELLAEELAFTLEDLQIERDQEISDAQREYEEAVREVHEDYEDEMADLQDKLADLQADAPDGAYQPVYGYPGGGGKPTNPINDLYRPRNPPDPFPSWKPPSAEWVYEKAIWNAIQWGTNLPNGITEEEINFDNIYGIHPRYKIPWEARKRELMADYRAELDAWDEDQQDKEKDKQDNLREQERVRRDMEEAAEDRDRALQALELSKGRTAERENRMYDFQKRRYTMKHDYEVLKTKRDAAKDYFDTEKEMEKDIRVLEADLAKTIFEIRQRYGSATGSFGVRHFLNKGGMVNMVEGAKRGVDSVKAMLTPGEYVIKEGVVNWLGSDFFEKLNSFQLPRLGFADGGLVPGAFSDSGGSMGSDTMLGTVNLQVGGKKYPMQTDLQLAKRLVREFKQMGMTIA